MFVVAGVAGVISVSAIAVAVFGGDGVVDAGSVVAMAVAVAVVV